MRALAISLTAFASRVLLVSTRLAREFCRAPLVTKLPDFPVDLLQDFARSFQFFFPRAGELRGIGERPVQTLRHSGKDRTAFGFCFAANRNDKWE